MNNYYKNLKVKCPFCKQKLQTAGEREYETLSEHVSDPNRIFPPKPYWECTCEKSKGVFWGIDGDMYGNFKLQQEIESKEKLPHSYYADWRTKLIGSWGRKYCRNNYFIELYKLKKIIKFYETLRLHLYLEPRIYIENIISYRQALKEIKECNMALGDIKLSNQNDIVMEKLRKDGYEVERKKYENKYQWYLSIKAKEELK